MLVHLAVNVRDLAQAKAYYPNFARNLGVSKLG
jgi:extradiol dioxygenase family protein